MTIEEKRENLKAVKRLDLKIIGRVTKVSTQRLLALAIGIMVILGIGCIGYIDWIMGG